MTNKFMKILTLTAFAGLLSMTGINYAVANQACESDCNDAFAECNNGGLAGDCLDKQTTCLEKCR